VGSATVALVAAVLWLAIGPYTFPSRA
jgi:hypothetical protein